MTPSVATSPVLRLRADWERTVFWGRGSWAVSSLQRLAAMASPVTER